MKKQILSYVLLSLIALLAFFSWREVSNSIIDSQQGNWFLPTIWFSFFFIFLFLGIFLIKNFYLLIEILSLSVFSSFLFTFSVYHLVICLLGLIFSIMGARRVREDLAAGVKINIWRSARMGRNFLILGISLIIAGQYYFQVKKLPEEKLFFQIQINEELSNAVVNKIVPLIFPDLRKIKDENLTVDQFILKTRKNQALNESDWINQPLILYEGRRQLSEIAGKELQGNEKMSEVFAEIFNKKIWEFLGPKSYRSENFSFLPAMLALVLFLTVFSLGSFLAPFWVALTAVIFWLIRKLGWVEINKITVEQEIIS